MRQETEDERRDDGLKRIADRHARRRIRLVDQARNATRDQVRTGRGFHVSIDHAPDALNSRRLMLIVAVGSRDRVVEVGADIAGLHIDDANIGILQLQLQRHA